MKFYLQQSTNIDLYLQLITEHINLHVEKESVHDEEFDLFFYVVFISDWRNFSQAAAHVLTSEQFQELILALEFAV